METLFGILQDCGGDTESALDFLYEMEQATESSEVSVSAQVVYIGFLETRKKTKILTFFKSASILKNNRISRANS